MLVEKTVDPSTGELLAETELVTYNKKDYKV